MTAPNRAGVKTVGGSPDSISATITRPANTTQYTAGDAVTNSTSAPVAMTFSDVALSKGGGGTIADVLLVLSANNTGTLAGDFELWLFQGAAAPTADNDNAAFTPTDAECADLVAIVAFEGSDSFVGTATAGAGGNVVYHPSRRALLYTCQADTKDLYGLLVVRNAYTPVTGEIFTVTLKVEQDS